MQAALDRNLRLYPWYLATTYEGISNAVWYLYLFVYKGLSLGEMAWLVLLGDGVIVLAEVPTGWLADRLGRRFSMITGIVLQAASALLFIFGDSFFTFWIAMATCGLGDTFRSGADQALLYDSCQAVGKTPRFRPLLAQAMFVATLVMVVSQISGGAIAHYISWELPFWLEVGFSACGFLAVIQMREAPRHGTAGSSSDSSAEQAIPALRNPWLRLLPLLGFAAFLSVLPELAHFHLPAELSASIGFTPLHLGFLYAAFELLQGFGNKLGGHHRLGNAVRTLPWIAVGMVICFALFGLRGMLGLWIYLLARAGIDFLWGLSEPLISEEANRRTTSAVRATALSVVNAGRRLVPLGVLPLSASLVAGQGNAPAHFTMLAALLLPLAAAALWLFTSSPDGADRSEVASGTD